MVKFNFEAPIFRKIITPVVGLVGRTDEVGLIDFSVLVRRVYALVGSERLHSLRMSEAEREELLGLLGQLRPRDARSLDKAGMDELIVEIKTLLSTLPKGTPRGTAAVVRMLLVWCFWLWAVEEVGGVRGIRAVTGTMNPVWRTTSVMSTPTAYGLGVNIVLLWWAKTGRSKTGRAARLRVVGGAVAWVTEDTWVVARASSQDSPRHRLPLVYDRIALGEVAGVVRVKPQLTRIRQVRIVFTDGSKAKFFTPGKVGKRRTLEVLQESLACYQGQAGGVGEVSSGGREVTLRNTTGATMVEYSSALKQAVASGDHVTYEIDYTTQRPKLSGPLQQQVNEGHITIVWKKV